MPSASSKEIVNDVKILTLIGKHPHVVDFYDAWIEDEQFNMQLAFVVGGSLTDFLFDNKDIFPSSDIILENHTNRISDVTGYVLLAQIASALVYMHDVLRLYHGDIKPSNILVDLVRYKSRSIECAKSECQKHLEMPDRSPMLRFKLCDFGRSGDCDVESLPQGDGRYLTFIQDDSVDFHTKSSGWDVYALGITLYECVSGFSLICGVGDG